MAAVVSEIYRVGYRQFVRGSYAQNYEDIIVDEILNKNVGTYLEIGAYHPTRLSNTYRFYKKGWRGVVVEPNPSAKKVFMEKRPDDRFMNVGVSESGDILDYYEFLIPALNTFSKEEAERQTMNGHKLIGIQKISTVKIDQLVDRNIDLLSLDTEGFDKIILYNWPWKKCRPKIICVEDEKVKIKDYMLVMRTKYNSIFVLKD